MNGWVAIGLIAALVFGETAIFLGFVLPGEAAVVLGGVLASRGHLSLPALIAVVVVTAGCGPPVGQQAGRRVSRRRVSRPALATIPPPPACGGHGLWCNGAAARVARPV